MTSPESRPRVEGERVVRLSHDLTAADYWCDEDMQNLALDHLEALARIERLTKAINWAMGCGPDDDFPACDDRHRYAWRPGLSRRAGLNYDATIGEYVAAFSLPTRLEGTNDE